MTKEQAAASLGVSMRTLQRMMSKHEIQFRQHRSERGGGLVAVFDEREVERVKRAREQALLHPTHAPAEKKSHALERKPAASELSAVLAQLSQLAGTPERNTTRAASAPIPNQIWLTRKQAAVLSGLPLALIVAASKAGVLPAVKLGAGWRIKRSDLETWADKFTG